MESLELGSIWRQIHCLFESKKRKWVGGSCNHRSGGGGMIFYERGECREGSGYAFV